RRYRRPVDVSAGRDPAVVAMIAEANPRVFARHGALARTIEALESSPAGPVVVELPQHRQVVSWAGETA
ncbi:MAG: hypothetical protein ACO213_06355, partial [Steroidobacteraceae bacterium]